MDGKHECDREAVANRINCSLSRGSHDDVRHMTYDDYQHFTLKWYKTGTTKDKWTIYLSKTDHYSIYWECVLPVALSGKGRYEKQKVQFNPKSSSPGSASKTITTWSPIALRQLKIRVLLRSALSLASDREKRFPAQASQPALFSLHWGNQPQQHRLAWSSPLQLIRVMHFSRAGLLPLELAEVLNCCVLSVDVRVRVCVCVSMCL